MNIMAAGSKTKVQDVNLKCTCPVCFSWQGIIGCKGMITHSDQSTNLST